MPSELTSEGFALIPCPVCDNKDLSAFLSIQYGKLKQKPSLDYSALGISEETWLHVKKCRRCGFVFVNPRLKPEHERAVYNECKANQNSRKWSPDSPEYRAQARKRRPVYVGRLLEAMSFVERDCQVPVVFDYGCGFGHSMSLARELGCDPYGVDIDEERLRICRELGLKVASPGDFDAQHAGFKADIILWQSNIEHLVDLPSAMRYVAAKARRGTVLFVNGVTPELISIERRRGEFVKAHFVEHVNFFPVRTLDFFMAKYGFRPLPFAHYSLVKTLGDAIKCLGAWLLMGPLGRGSWRGYFQRFYRMEEKGHGR